MKIIFLSEFYAPDSAIGAIRINKLSKYLHEFGHDVTVLCSSKSAARIDENLLKELKGISIYRYDQKAGDNQYTLRNKNRTSKINRNIRKLLITVYMRFFYPFIYIKETIKSKNEIVDYYEKNLKDERYDLIFATFSPRATIEAGILISRKYNIPLISDFRDLMDNMTYHPIIRLWNRSFQQKAILKSECAYVVSEGQRNILISHNRRLSEKIDILNNGYDRKNENDKNEDMQKASKDELVLVYTGSIYDGRYNLRPLYETIKEIMDERGYLFRIVYAGRDSDLIADQMHEYGIEYILEDHRLVTKTESEQLQKSADLFLVASCNTKREQGILTGKFFEGIQSKKCILSLIKGNVPNSDLYLLNMKYNYGFCYEECQSDSKEKLKEYLINCCEQKKKNGCLPPTWSDDFSNDFSYYTISRKLELKMNEIVKNV